MDVLNGTVAQRSHERDRASVCLSLVDQRAAICAQFGLVTLDLIQDLGTYAHFLSVYHQHDQLCFSCYQVCEWQLYNRMLHCQNYVVSIHILCMMQKHTLDCWFLTSARLSFCKGAQLAHLSAYGRSRAPACTQSVHKLRSFDRDKMSATSVSRNDTCAPTRRPTDPPITDNRPASGGQVDRRKGVTLFRDATIYSRFETGARSRSTAERGWTLSLIRVGQRYSFTPFRRHCL